MKGPQPGKLSASAAPFTVCRQGVLPRAHQRICVVAAKKRAREMFAEIGCFV
jgi:hypothetical protein